MLAGAFHTAMQIVYRYDRVRELRRLGALGSGPVRRRASKRKTSRCGEEELPHKKGQENALRILGEAYFSASVLAGAFPHGGADRVPL